MKCCKCGRENRNEALYCKFCGTLLMQKQSEIQEESIIGHKEIIDRLKGFVNTLINDRRRESAGYEPDMKNRILLFMGEPGTGKSIVADWFIDILKKNQLLSSEVETIDAKKLKQNYGDEFLIGNFLHQTSNKFLIIDNLHEDVDYAAELLRAASVNKLGKICICTGYNKPLDKFLEEHPDIKQKVDYTLNFKSYSDIELKDILKGKILQKGYSFSEDMDDLLLQFVTECNKNPNKEHINGYLIEEIWNKIYECFSTRVKPLENPDLQTIYPEDIPIRNTKKTEAEIFAELDDLIGLEEVKKQIRELYVSVKMTLERRKLGITAELPQIHIVFRGKPGTGKTTVARILGELFYSIGLLPSPNIVEADRSKLVAQYVGQTAPLVNACCDKAIGGLLFIDEAYSLKQGDNDSYGQEAIDTLLKRIEDDRGKFILIVAGYPSEMNRFLKANPGLESRFNTDFNFIDYSPNELLEIFKRYATKNGFSLTDKAMLKASVVIKKIYASRTNDFANAREMRNLYDRTKRDFDNRIAALPENQRTTTVLQTIEAEDIAEVA